MTIIHPPRIFAVMDSPHTFISRIRSWNSSYGEPQEYISLSEHEYLLKKQSNISMQASICKKKKRFLDEDSALNYAKCIQKKNYLKNNNKLSGIYKCQTCGFFHLTTQQYTS